jgi:hypothetical protein
MAGKIISGDAGETWVNDTGKVKYQFIVNWLNSCGLCAQYDRQIGDSWPIPLHRGCRCHQKAIWPGAASLPFADFRAEVANLSRDQQARVIGRANLLLVERGVVEWSDVVTPVRVRDLHEVVALEGLTVERMVKAAVPRAVAEAAYATVHTPAHELAEAQRADLIARLAAKGVQKAGLKRAVAARLAARVTIGAGPSGPQGSPVVPGDPKVLEDYLVASGVKKEVAKKAAAKVKAKAKVKVEKTADQKEAERVAAEAAKATAEAARLKAERKEDERLARVEAEYFAKVEAEDKAKAAAEKAAAEKAAAEKAAAEKAAAEKAAAEKAAKGSTILPGRPIAERLQAYTEGDRKVSDVLAIGEEFARRKAELEAQGAEYRRGLREIDDATTGAMKLPKKKQEAVFAEIKAKGEALEAMNAARKAEMVTMRDRQREAVVKALAVDDPASIALEVDVQSGRFGSSRVPLDSAQRAKAAEAQSFLARLTRASDATVSTPILAAASGQSQRAYYRNGVVLQVGQEDNTDVYVHEMGHALEYQMMTAGSPAIDRSREFLDHRIAGETPQKFTDLFPKSNYESWEVGAKDKFTETFGSESSAYYTGKVYPKGIDYTEILPMGVQQLYNDPVGFAQRDPEYFKFVAGMLDGSLR